jgi:hypothetical protein
MSKKNLAFNIVGKWNIFVMFRNIWVWIWVATLKNVKNHHKNTFFFINERKLLKYNFAYEQHIHFCVLVAIGE